MYQDYKGNIFVIFAFRSQLRGLHPLYWILLRDSSDFFNIYLAFQETVYFHIGFHKWNVSICMFHSKRFPSSFNFIIMVVYNFGHLLEFICKLHKP